MLASQGIPFQVVPGVTAASGCSAYAGIPLTHRDHAQACIFVTGHGKDGHIDLDWKALLQPRQTVAIYMGLSSLAPLQQLLAELDAAASDGDKATMGEVYLVGAGPGDPDLLTFRALRLMQRADVVLFDRLIGKEVMNLVRRDAERIYVGKLPQNHTVPQEEISAPRVRVKTTRQRRARFIS